MIPIYVSHGSSDRAEKLGRRLAETINTFRRENGELRPGELRQALHLAVERTVPPAPRAILGLLMGIMVAGGTAAFLLSRSGQSDAPMIAIALSVAAALFVFFVFIKRS